MTTQTKISTWLAWALVTIFYAYQYVLRVLPNVIMPDLMSRFDMDANLFGQFAGVYYITYAGMQIPIGIWLDRKGPKYILSICVALTAMGILPLLYSHSWIMACIGRALVGLGSAAGAIGMFKVIHLGFPGKRFGLMLGLSVSIGVLAAVYGGQPMSTLLDSYGYERVIEWLLYVGLILSAICFVVLPKISAAKAAHESVLDTISQLWKTKKVFLIGIFAGLMVAPLEGFADAWGTSFLQAMYSYMDKNQTAFLPSLILFGMCVGSILLPYIAAKTKRYYHILIGSAFIMAASFIMLLSVTLNSSIIAVLMSVIGFLCAYQIVAIDVSTTHVKENLVGVTTATVNMLIMSFGYFFHSIIGKVIQTTSAGKIISGIGNYSLESLRYGISVIPITLIIGGIGFMWIRKR